MAFIKAAHEQRINSIKRRKEHTCTRVISYISDPDLHFYFFLSIFSFNYFFKCFVFFFDYLIHSTIIQFKLALR